MGKVINVDANKYFSKVMGRFDAFRRSEQHCDFKLKTGSEEILVHRDVLAASSDYFNAMLTHDTLESRAGFVEIKEADVECVKKCIDFMYTAKISVAEGKYGALMHVAHLFQLTEVCDGIAALLERNLDASSFFLTKRLANMYNCKRLDEKCDQYALKNFDVISEANEFVQLDEDYISFLMESRDINACESTKCDALVKWVRRDAVNRQEFFIATVEKLELFKVPAKNLGYLLKTEPLVFRNEECIKLFTRTLLEKLNIEVEPFKGDVEKWWYMVVFDKTSKFVQRFNTEQRSWTPMQPLLDEMVKTAFSAVVVYDCIYTLMENKHVYRLKYSDPHASWVRMADMNENRGAFPPSAVVGNCIYTIGSHTSAINSAEKYDPLANDWTYIQEKTIPCSYGSIARTNEAVYCIGGLDQRCNNLNKVERFNPVTEKWNFVAPMSQGRSNCGAIELNGEIYVMGGFSGHDLKDMEVYSPTTNTWTELNPMKSFRQLPATVAMDNKIYAIGGRGAKSIEVYNPQTDEWEIIATWEEMVLINRSSIAIWQYRE